MEFYQVFSKQPRCQVVPLPDQQVSFVIDGAERLRWHASDRSPRPFFFPFLGPSGIPLTRMGHPGAPNHDHHRSIWFAHHRVLGIDFWSDQSSAVIRQVQWKAYEDGESEGRMAVDLAWYDGHDPQPLILQELIVEVRPGNEHECFLEIQTSLKSVSQELELGITNFGLLAIRVAKSISAAFGSGQLTGPGGIQGEPKLFGQSMAWVDYSGEVDTGVIEGITYYDHPDNSTFPSKWHVRDDGWMGASICRDAPVMLMSDEPVTYRYLLHAHSGLADSVRIREIAKSFGESPGLIVQEDARPHHSAIIRRKT